jgi:TolB protein
MTSRVHILIFRLIMIVSGICIISGNGSAQTDIHLSTEKAGAGRIPIVVRDIDAGTPGEMGVAGYVTTVLRQDLLFTDIFEPLSFEGDTDILAEGRTATAIIEGSLSREGEHYILDTRLLDYSSREEIFSKRYRFRRNVRRTVAHHICDEVLFFLVGEKGIATTRLLFARRENGIKNLYMIDYDGYGERQVTKDELVVSPLWLDEGRFVFTSYRRDNPDCYLIDLEKNVRRNISHRKGMNIAGAYNRELDEIAMTLSLRGNSEIYRVKSDGSIVKRLTNNRAIEISASWSPNGREIVFVSDRTRSPQLYVMDYYGGNVRRLTKTGSYNTSPSWSPEGDLIAFVSREGWLYRLRLISPDGLWEETVFNDYYSYEDPVWAPDGRHMAVTVKYGEVPWIVIVDIETGRRRKLIRGESADWSPLAGG